MEVHALAFAGGVDAVGDDAVDEVVGGVGDGDDEAEEGSEAEELGEELAGGG